jgi:CRP-like cAMP-binding protein
VLASTSQRKEQLQNTKNLDDIRENKLLAALPSEIVDRLAPSFESVALPPFEVLYNYNEEVTHLYFPHKNTVVSALCTADEGVQVEVGLMGSESVVGFSGILGSASPYVQLVQVPGTGTRIAIAVAIAEFERGGRFQSLLLAYTHMLLVQVSQTALCNRIHSDPERLSRWLLLSDDRVQSHQLPLPRELLAKMLGQSQSSVSITSAILEKAGFIAYNGAEMTIINREGLEGVACSCYWLVKRHKEAF